MRIALFIVLGLLVFVGIGILYASYKMRLQIKTFIRESVVYRGTVLGYVQDQLSPFLSSPVYEYELISGEKRKGSDFILSSQQTYRKGQVLDIYVHKMNTQQITARTSRLFLPSWVVFTLGTFTILTGGFGFWIAIEKFYF